MKKSLLFVSALALVAGLSACNGDNDNKKPDFGNLVLDGFYVYGEATGTDKVDSKFAMSSGINEVDGALRTGLFEKYIWLEADKEFALIENIAGQKTYYGADLSEVNYGYDENDPNCKNFDNNPNMPIQYGHLVIGESAPMMKVKETGLYHIILDNNVNNDLPDGAQIIVQKAIFGVRGGMNGWGYTEAGDVNVTDDGTITYTWKDQNLAANGEFKFSSCNGWKINLDVDGKVKAHVSLGLDEQGAFTAGGNNIKVEKAGLYDITLTYKVAAGEIIKSFNYNVTLTKESDLPTTMFMIGNDFGNWDWASDGIVSLSAVNGHQGQFWAIRYLTTDTQFKFCALKEWNGDFTGKGEDSGYIVADGNCKVETDGLYMIFVDVENGVTIEPAQVFGMGECFGNWDADTHPFKVEGRIASATIEKDGALRMYAYSSKHASADWWQMEFNIYDGVIEYRADGGDQAAVNATAGQTVTLDFTAGTGSIK